MRRSLFEIYPQYDPRNGDSPAGPSGRSGGVPAHVAGKYQQHYPIMPAVTPRSGQTGMPSSEFSVMASRFMQNNTMNHDDIEYYAAIHDNPPYDVDRQVVARVMPVTSNNSNPNASMFPEQPDDSWRDLEEGDYPLDMGGNRGRAGDGTDDGSARRAYALQLIDEDEDEEEEPEVDEASTTANVRGYTGPLGAAPPKVPGGKGRKKPHWQAYADSFARAKPVD